MTTDVNRVDGARPAPPRLYRWVVLLFVSLAMGWNPSLSIAGAWVGDDYGEGMMGESNFP